MFKSSRRCGAQTIFAIAMITAAFSVSAASASAATFCIDVPVAECPSGATALSGGAGITTALSQSVSNGSGQDTIFIQSGTYEAATGWDAQTSNVKLVGVGPTKPVLSVPVAAPAFTTVLHIQNAFAQVANLALVTATTIGAVGIDSDTGGSVISDVEVSSPGAASTIGIQISGQGSSILRPNINLPFSGIANSTGISGDASSSLVVNDSSITAWRAFHLSNGAANVQVKRSQMHSCVGAEFQNSWGTVSSSLIDNPASGTPCNGVATGIYQTIDNGLDNTSTPVLSTNNTIIGHGYASSGAVQSDTDGNDSTARVNVDSSVIFGYDKAFLATPVGTNSAAVIAASYSRYQGSTSDALLLDQVASLSGDPGFVNAAGGDYRLQKTSQLIDAGSPASLTQNESSTDLMGGPRVASRGAGNIRDIGAFELSNGAPVASIAIGTSNPTTTSPTTFSGSDSSDPDGDAMTFNWKFDNGQFSTGEVVGRTISTSGPHTIDLTVTDSTGVASTTSLQYNVAKGSLSLLMNRKAIRATGRGDFAVRLFCPDQASSNCNGKLSFKTTDKKQLKAATYVFSVEPGTTRKLPITTTKTFRNLLIKKQKVRLRMSANGTTGNAALIATATTFSLSAPQPKK